MVDPVTPEELRQQAEEECRDAPELVEDRYRELLALAGHEDAVG